MNYAESVARHAERNPVTVERWSAFTERWIHISDEPSAASAARRVAMARARGDEAEYQIKEQER